MRQAVGGARFRTVPAHSRSCEGPAVDDDAFEIPGRDVGVPQQLDHRRERLVGHHVPEVVRVDEVADHGDRETVVHGGGQLGVLLHQGGAGRPDAQGERHQGRQQRASVQHQLEPPDRTAGGMISRRRGNR